MVNDIKKWLLKPYPFPTSNQSKLLISFGFGIFIFFFLYVFKPFNFFELKNKMLYNAIVYGLITMSVLLIHLILFPFLFKKIFNPNNWNIYKMLFFVTEIILIIGVLNTLFNDKDGSIKIGDFLFFIMISFLIGVFPMFVYVYITERSANKKNKAIAESISLKRNDKPKQVINNKETLIINGENKNEKIEIFVKRLIYITSEKNYASVFYLENEKIKEVLLRTSLNKIELQLKEYPYIIRCHKSYIVNTSKVEKIEGNARNYLLRIPQIEMLIPVSRSFPKELLFTLIS